MQDSLFPTPTQQRRPPGRHESMLVDVVAAARAEGRITNADNALVSLALANAWALDEIEQSGKVGLIGNVTAPYREVLEKLKLTPAESDAAAADSFARAVAALSAE